MLLSLPERSSLNTYEEALALQQEYSNADEKLDYHYDKNDYVQALGRTERETGNWRKIDFTVDSIKLEAGEALLLCTDGIHDNLKDSEMEACLQNLTSDNQQGAADGLLARTIARSQDEENWRHKRDDMSFIIASIKA